MEPTASEWVEIAEALEFAAQSADDEADAIRRGYSSGTNEDRAAHATNAEAWRSLAARIWATTAEPPLPRS